MAISETVKTHLTKLGITYDVITHDHTGASMETAEAAHISGESVAKAVVLKDDEGYVMAIIPATYKLSPNEIYDHFGRHMHLVHEEELANLFKDCELGAVPPLASAYGMDAVWDESLANLKDVYIESGDHDNLLRIDGNDFRALMGQAPHANFSHHV